MNELCVPLPGFDENQIAQVEVTIGEKKEKYNFKVESFNWLTAEGISTDSDALHAVENRISALRTSIEGYDKNWELIQIYTPAPGADHIQVLFRQKHSR
ncbi:MAG: hypothetical protein H8D46_03425 [FCB group bacterium]|nr:hypothetical protein [FCB group bacterium]